MGEKKYTNIQRHATERSILFDLKTKFDEAKDAMVESLQDYHTARHISVEEVPRDLEVADRILARFYKKVNTELKRENKNASEDEKLPEVENIFDLVEYHRDKLADAVDFARAPGKLDSRNEFRATKRALERIKENLITYDQLVKDNATDVAQSEQDPRGDQGFKLYYQRVQLIKDFTDAYDQIMTFTEQGPIDPLNIPESNDDLKKALLSLPAPGGDGKSEDSVAEDGEEEVNLPAQGERFEIGSDQDLALFNVHIHRLVTQDVANHKLACYQVPLGLRIEYNSCVMQQKQDADTICADLNKQYEISRLNCMSHYPMVTRSDKVIDSMFDKAETMHATLDENGEYQMDMESVREAIQDFETIVDYVQIANPKALPNVEHTTGEEVAKQGLSDFQEKISNTQLPSIAGPDVKLIGDSVEGHGGGDS